MDLIRIKNKQEYIKLIKFLYNRKNFGCVEDWDYFFELDIFSSYKDEEYKEYLKRLEGLEGKTNDQIVKEFNNLKASGIPEENMFPSGIPLAFRLLNSFTIWSLVFPSSPSSRLRI